MNQNRLFKLGCQLILLALAFCLPQAAFAENDDRAKACYNILSDLPNGFEVNTDQTVFYLFRVATPIGCFTNITVNLSFQIDTPNLQANTIQAGNKNAAVYVAPGAHQDSRFTVFAEVRHRSTGFVVGSSSRQMRLHVRNGVIERPDLVVNSIFFPANPSAGEVNISARVRNQGPAAQNGSFRNRLRLNGASQGDRSCSNLSSNETCSPSWRLNLTAGNHNIQVCADSANDVNEGNQEGNNCTQETISVSDPDLSDLVVDSISVLPNPIQVGQEGTVTVRVRNQGATRSPSFAVRLSTDGYSDTKNCSPRNIGASCTLEFDWTPNAARTYRLTATADPNGNVPEEIETNNSKNLDFVVGLPEFFFHVDGVQVSPSAPTEGEAATFTFRMYNSGLSHISPAPRMLIQGSGGINQTFVCNEGIPNASYCERTLDVIMPSEGSHWITAIADPLFEIEEITETNNSRTLNYLVDGPSLDVTCAGTWRLTGTDGVVFTGQGSVENNCSVRFAENSPISCWRTSGQNGLVANWIQGADGCPIRADVDDPSTPQSVDFQFYVSISP